MSTTLAEATRDNLLAELNKVIETAEQLLKSASHEGEEQTEAFIARAEENLKAGKARLIELEALMIGKTRAAAKATDHYVHEHTWQTIGMFAGMGVLLGLLLNRR
ncbi:MAG TPA: DUF883 family protein [Pseudomonadales bacterium]|nr:DUF883 family protein [Pseudomonadales bacterium]